MRIPIDGTFVIEIIEVSMFWTLVAASVPLLLYFLFIKPFTYWKNKGVAQQDVSQLWIGLFNAMRQLKAPAEGLQESYSNFPSSRYVGIYQLFHPTLLLRDPDLIKQITVKDFDYFLNHSEMLPSDADSLLENALFSLKGNKWRRMRSTLSPAFTSSKMKAMFGLISECADNFVAHFQNKGTQTITVEMKDIFGRFGTDVIASTAFGVKCDSLKHQDNDFYNMVKAASNFAVLNVILFVAVPRLAKFLGLKLFQENVRTFFKKLVTDSMEIRAREEIVRPDMIHLLMEAKKVKLKNEIPNETENEGFAAEEKTIYTENTHLQQINDDDIAANAFGFFLAGFETVSSCMSFLAYELAVNPDVQERLQREVDETLSSCGGSMAYDPLIKMKYLDMVVSESLRKWPPAIATDRLCVKPYTIEPKVAGEKPLQLTKGDVILLPVYGFHRDPLHYPEPDRFDPERFNDENKVHINPYTYFPFGIGPRGCIGNRFALMEIKVVITHLLSKFNIMVIEKTSVPLSLGPNPITLSPKDGFWLGLKARDAKS